MTTMHSKALPPQQRSLPRIGVLLVLAGFALAIPTLPASPESGGEVKPQVECLKAKSVTYALYLPKGYDPARKWPVLIGFDPGGRGLAVIETFREAADAYGWIVTGSNDFRNGPWKDSLPGIETYWNDVVARYAVDPRRIYTTGFSGGARVAGGMAWVQQDKVAGVVACGAGLPEGMRLAPGDLRAAYLGVVGEMDFNYMEMQDLESSLAALGVTRHRLVFPGGHVWPPAETVKAALQWMEIQAMRQGRRPPDGEICRQWYERTATEARAREQVGDLPRARGLWDSLALDKEAFPKAAEAAAEAARISQRTDFPAAEKACLRRAEQEREARDNVYAVWAKAFAPGRPLPDLAKLLKELKVASWQERMRAPGITALEATSCRRVLTSLAFMVLGDAQSSPDQPAGRRLLDWRLAASALPENPSILYNLACAWAQAGKTPEALGALEEAVKHGFRDKRLLLSDPDLASLRSSPRFEEVLKTLPGE